MEIKIPKMDMEVTYPKLDLPEAKVEVLKEDKEVETYD